MGIKIKVEGAEDINENENFVIIMNHQSLIDVLGIFKTFQQRFCSKIKFLVMAKLIIVLGNLSAVVKKELIYIPPLAIAIYLCDGIFLDRYRRESSIKSLTQLSANLNKSPVSLILEMFYFKFKFFVP